MEFPKHWNKEHVITSLVRHFMLVDNDVSQDEMNWMAKTIEDYEAFGIDVGGVWDSVDDELMEISKNGDYSLCISHSMCYVRDNFDHQEKQQLMFYLSNMTAQDNIVQYKEYIFLELISNMWFPGQLDLLLNNFRKNGIEVITNEDSSSASSSLLPSGWTDVHLVCAIIRAAGAMDGEIKQSEVDILSSIETGYDLEIGEVWVDREEGLAADEGCHLEEMFSIIWSEVNDFMMTEQHLYTDRVREAILNVGQNFTHENKEKLFNFMLDTLVVDYELSEKEGMYLRECIEQWFSKDPESYNSIVNTLKERGVKVCGSDGEKEDIDVILKGLEASNDALINQLKELGLDIDPDTLEEDNSGEQVETSIKIPGKYMAGNFIHEIKLDGTKLSGILYKEKTPDKIHGTFEGELNNLHFDGVWKNNNNDRAGRYVFEFNEEGFKGKFSRDVNNHKPKGKWDGVRLS